MIAPRLGDDSMRVVVTRVRNGDLGTYDFAIPGAPPGLMKPLKAVFERKTRPPGRWRTRPVIERAAQAARQFAEAIVAAKPGITGIDDLTPLDLRRWYISGTAGFPPPQADISAVRTFLRAVAGLPEPTREYVARQHQPYRGELYSTEEQQILVFASWLLIKSACIRIAASRDVLACLDSGTQSADEVRVRIGGKEWSGRAILKHISRWGKMPDGNRENLSALRKYLCVGEQGYSAALFPSAGEIFALQILFVTAGSYPDTVLNEMEVGEFGVCEFDPASLLAEGDESHAVTPGPPHTVSVARARLHGIAEFLTQGVRETLATLGHGTNRLFVASATTRKSSDPTGSFVTDWSRAHWAARSWQRLTGVGDSDGAPPNLKRLLADVRPSDTPAGSGTLSVHVTGDDGGDLGTDDFTDLRVPTDLVAPLCAALTRLSGPGGEWRSREAFRAGAGILRRIVRELTATNPGVVALDDITPEMWSAWSTEARRSAHGSRVAVDLAHTLLREARWPPNGGTTPDADDVSARPQARRTAAVLPEIGWRPDEPVSADGRKVTAAAEGGFVCDFSSIDAPDNLIEPIVAAFAPHAGIAGGWKSVNTVRVAANNTKRFVRDIVAANPGLEAIEDLTAEMWWEWTAPAQGKAPPDSVVKVVRFILRDIDALRGTTRRALYRRRPVEPEDTPSPYPGSTEEERASSCGWVLRCSWDNGFVRIMYQQQGAPIRC